jgi:hypothetical protein
VTPLLALEVFFAGDAGFGLGDDEGFFGDAAGFFFGDVVGLAVAVAVVAALLDDDRVIARVEGILFCAVWVSVFVVCESTLYLIEEL